MRDASLTVEVVEATLRVTLAPFDPIPRASIVLPHALRAEIARAALAAYPSEGCGLMIGRRDAPRSEVMHVRTARNLRASLAGDQYEIDPVDHLAAESEARALGLDVIGIWHSHPDRPAEPSESDRAQAWSGWSYVIASVCDGAMRDLRSWRLVGESFVEETVLPAG